jgi:hypothetical protein
MGFMNKTYTDLIGESYKNYLTITEPTFMGKNISLPEYIHWVKSDDEYSQKWGLKIEERELSLEERQKLCVVWTEDSYGVDGELRSPLTIDWEKTPKRAITITYNNETIESYE